MYQIKEDAQFDDVWRRMCDVNTYTNDVLVNVIDYGQQTILYTWRLEN